MFGARWMKPHYGIDVRAVAEAVASTVLQADEVDNRQKPHVRERAAR